MHEHLCFSLENLGIKRLRNLHAEVDAHVEQRVREHRDVVAPPKKRVLIL